MRAQEPDSTQSALSGQGPEGALYNPGAAGNPRQPTSAKDNDAEIKHIEQRLRCTCGCTLDVFTCRTTDFTCTYSPAMHREVIALHDAGKSPQQIVDAFVVKYGETVLMAPKPEGFNLAGYWMPAAVVTVMAAGLAWYIRRRASVAAAEGTPVVATPSAATPTATPDELERLRRQLAEVED